MTTATLPATHPTIAAFLRLHAERPFVATFLRRLDAGEALPESQWAAAGRLYTAMQPKQVELPIEPEFRANRHPGTCADCEQVVLAGEGRLGERNPNRGNHFDVHHLPGQCPEDREAVLAGLLADDTLAKRRFAVPSLGSNDLDFLYVAEDRKGGRSIKQIIGGHGATEINLGLQITYAQILAAMTPDQRFASMILFGRALKICGACGSELTKDTSRAAGIGPKCAEKGGC